MQSSLRVRGLCLRNAVLLAFLSQFTTSTLRAAIPLLGRCRNPAKSPRMATMTRGWVPVAGCVIVSAAVTVLAQMLSHPAPFHPSQLLSVASTDPLSALLLPLSPDFRFTVASDHYDGVYFLAMALDPLALGDAHNLIDLGAYRYGHPLRGWLAMLLSLGQPAALPWAFWTISVASMALASGTSGLLRDVRKEPVAKCGGLWLPHES